MRSLSHWRCFQSLIWIESIISSLKRLILERESKRSPNVMCGYGGEFHSRYISVFCRDLDSMQSPLSKGKAGRVSLSP